MQGNDNTQKVIDAKFNIADILTFKTKSVSDMASLITTLGNTMARVVEKKGNREIPYADSISTAQLRNLFTKVVKLKKPEEAQLMRPLVIYAAARQSNDRARCFFEDIELILQKITDSKSLESYKTFMEAVVAYHKRFSSNN